MHRSIRKILLGLLLITASLTNASSQSGVPSPSGECSAPFSIGGAPARGANEDVLRHGGGLNACGCHFNRKTGECHCHQARGCGCACQPATCW